MVLRSFSLGIGFILLMIFGFFRGIEIRDLINIQSLIIVLGGTALVLYTGFPSDRLRETCSAVMTALRQKNYSLPETLLPEILELARIYRVHGPIALEKAKEKVEHDFLHFGATLIVEGYDEWSLMNSLERENHLRHEERKAQICLLRILTRVAPALGMAGTVISLMHVMKNLGNTEGVGSSLGLALSSTLYGILLANLIFLPLASKLEELNRNETRERSMIMEALRGVQRADHPLRIAERLNSYDIYCRMKRERDQERRKTNPVDPVQDGMLEEGRT